MKRSLLSMIALVSTISAADLPYTFSPNTKAKAAEVNANFNNLDTRTTTLEGRVAALESSGSGGVDANTIHLITYTPQFKNVGDQFTLNGRTYAMYRIPFVEYRTGDHYAVTFPAKISDSSSQNRYANLSTTHSNEPFKSEFQVNGIPAGILYWSDGRNITIRNTSSTAQQYDVNIGISSVFQMKVNDTRVDISFQSVYEQQQKVENLPINQFDMVPSANFSLYTHPDLLITELDTLIDFVRVEKLP